MENRQQNMQVRYVRTHTTGKVNDILVKEDVAWIKLDSNGLYYRSDYIEVIEDIEIHIKPNKKRVKSEKFGVANPTAISDHADGPWLWRGLNFYF